MRPVLRYASPNGRGGEAAEILCTAGCMTFCLYGKPEAVSLGLSRGEDDLERRGLVAEKKARERRHPNHPRWSFGWLDREDYRDP